MRSEYDFRGARCGANDPAPAGKTRITIRLDNDVLEWFRGQVEAAGGGSYQSLINAALGQYIAGAEESIEDTLRRVVREELESIGLASRLLEERVQEQIVLACAPWKGRASPSYGQRVAGPMPSSGSWIGAWPSTRPTGPPGSPLGDQCHLIAARMPDCGSVTIWGWSSGPERPIISIVTVGEVRALEASIRTRC